MHFKSIDALYDQVLESYKFCYIHIIEVALKDYPVFSLFKQIGRYAAHLLKSAKKLYTKICNFICGVEEK